MKKLLIIVGAGASLDFGMPSVNEIDNLFKDWAKVALPLKDDVNKSLYTWVKEKLDLYIQQNPKNREGSIINFESLLFTIQNISGISRDDHWLSYNNRIRPFVELQDFPEIVRFGKTKIADTDDFHFLHSYLVDSLLDHFREKCKTLTVDKSNELTQLTQFILSLKKSFDVGFVNLNYDNVILSALPDLNTGFDSITNEFDRGELYKSKWNFCYHLHGSVYFDMKGGDGIDMHKIVWNKDLNSDFSQNSSGRSGNYTSEGMDHLNSAIIAGLDKTNQLVREPFGPYYMQLDRLIYESDSILFMGYGFSDLHLNRAFTFIRYDKTKKRKIVIIDFALKSVDGLGYRHDAWSYGVLTTLPFNGHEMGDSKSILPQPVAYFKRHKKLEKSRNSDYPLAVWYDGILEACNYANKIIKELK
jgi:hypothetical protein